MTKVTVQLLGRWQRIYDMRPNLFTKPRFTYVLAGIGVVCLTPTKAWSCNYCALGFINLAFPFLNSGLLILGTWRILYAIWQWYRYRPTLGKAVFAVAKRAVLLLFLYGTAWQGGILIYLMVSLAKALLKTVNLLARIPRFRFSMKQVFEFLHSTPPWESSRPFRQPTAAPPRNDEAESAGATEARPVSLQQKWTLVLLHAMALALIVPVAGHAYRERARADDLEKLVRYVHPGTGPSRGIAYRIAHDPNFDLERLRPMLLSTDWNLYEKGYEVLQVRRKPEDVVRFLDVLMPLEDGEFSMETSVHHSWMPLWISEVCGSDVRTKAQLLEWVRRKFPSGLPDKPPASPSDSPAAGP